VGKSKFRSVVTTPPNFNLLITYLARLRSGFFVPVAHALPACLSDDSYVEPIPHGLHLGSYSFDDSYVEPIRVTKVTGCLMLCFLGVMLCFLGVMLSVSV